MTYHVTAKRWGRYWELYIKDGTQALGVTQCRALDHAECMVRDYLAVRLDLDDARHLDIVIKAEDTTGRPARRPAT